MNADELLGLIKNGLPGRNSSKFPTKQEWEHFFAWERPAELAKLRRDIRERWETKVVIDCVDMETGRQYRHPSVPQITREQSV